jgi:uncharacterized protein YjaZ
VTISLDPRPRPGLSRSIRTWLPQTILHELHHSARIVDGPGYGSALLEAMVSEGLADAFAQQALNTPRPPWEHAFGPDRERQLWHRAENSLSVLDFPDVHARWFFGSGDLPRWTGYTIGDHIVRDYLKRHPKVQPGQLVHADAWRILHCSGYPTQPSS